jgi:hypothetical protein
MSGATAPTTPATMAARAETGTRRIRFRIETDRMYPEGACAMNMTRHCECAARSPNPGPQEIIALPESARMIVGSGRLGCGWGQSVKPLVRATHQHELRRWRAREDALLAVDGILLHRRVTNGQLRSFELRCHCVERRTLGF